MVSEVPENWLRSVCKSILFLNLLQHGRGKANVKLVRAGWGTGEQIGANEAGIQNWNRSSHNNNSIHLHFSSPMKLKWINKSQSECVHPSFICACMIETELTVVHEAIVAEPHAQHHSVLSGRAVSLGNRVNDAHSRLDTMPVYTFSYKAHCITAGLRLSVCLLERRWWSASWHVLINMCLVETMSDGPRMCSSLSPKGGQMQNNVNNAQAQKPNLMGFSLFSGIDNLPYTALHTCFEFNLKWVLIFHSLLSMVCVQLYVFKLREKVIDGQWFYLQQQPVNQFARRHHRFKGFQMVISVPIAPKRRAVKHNLPSQYKASTISKPKCWWHQMCLIDNNKQQEEQDCLLSFNNVTGVISVINTDWQYPCHVHVPVHVCCCTLFYICPDDREHCVNIHEYIEEETLLRMCGSLWHDDECCCYSLYFDLVIPAGAFPHSTGFNKTGDHLIKMYDS